MFIKKSLALLFACLTLGAYAQSQDAWHFDRLRQAALNTHPLMQGKRAARVVAQAERDGAEWQRYPTPSAEVSTQANGVGVVRVDQPLWTGGRITASIDAARSRLDAATVGVDEAALDVTLKVIAATVEAQRQQIRERHGLDGVRLHEELLAMIQRRVTQEVSSMADQRLASSRLLASTNELSVIQQARQNALAQLTQLAGQPVRVLAEQGVGDVPVPPSLDEAITQALAFSPVLRRLAHEESVAEAEIATRRSAYLPQVVLRLESNRSERTTDNRGMLVLLAQPGAGLSAQSGVDAALAKREAARLAREAAERELRERVTLDWNEWSAARNRAKLAGEARSMSREVYESYARQYTAGRKSWIDVLNAVREAVQSEWTVADTHAQMLGASLRLRALMGALPISGAQVR